MNYFKSTLFIASIFLLPGCKDFSEKPDLSKSFLKLYSANNIEQAGKLDLTSDGGFVVVGTTQISTENTDITVFRSDKQGNLIWKRTYGGLGLDSGSAVKTLSDGGFIVAGTFSDPSRLTNMYLMRLASNGDTLWTKKYNEVRKRNSYGYDVNLSTDNNFFLVSGGILEQNTVTGLRQGYVRKVELNGNIATSVDIRGIIGTNTAGSTGYQVFATSVLDDENQNIIWSGMSGAGGVGLTPYIGKATNRGIIATYAIKSDPSINESSMEDARQMIKTNDGGYIMVGSSINSKGFSIGYVFKFSFNGNNISKAWYKNSYLEEGHIFFTVSQTNDGGYILGGGVAGNSDKTKGGGVDIVLVKIDSEGNFQWKSVFGGPEFDYATSVKQTEDGGFLVASYNTLLASPTNSSVIAVYKLTATGELKN